MKPGSFLLIWFLFWGSKTVIPSRAPLRAPSLARFEVSQKKGEVLNERLSIQLKQLELGGAVLYIPRLPREHAVRTPNAVWLIFT